MKALLAAILAIPALLVGAAVLLSLVFGLSSNAAYAAHGACSMSAIEQGIPKDASAAHLRACMAAKGYKTEIYCFVESWVTPGCFYPTWMFWVKGV